MDNIPIPPTPQEQSQNVAPLKKSSKWRVVLLVVFGIVIIGGILLYPWVKGQLELYVLQKKFSLENHPELALVPVQLDLLAHNTSTSQRFSYYGVTFNIPWQETPKIVTSKDNFATQLKFSGGQFVTILASCVYTNVADAWASASESDKANIKKLYGDTVTSSDYNYLMTILNATPLNVGPGQTILLTLKYPFFGFVGKNAEPLAIRNFSLPTVKGIELLGQDKTTSQVSAITFLFDAQGKGAHDFVIGGATEDEINSILASIQMN